MRTRLHFLCAALLLAGAAAGCAAARQGGGAERVTRFRTGNGLRVVLRPIEGARETAVVLLLSVGGSHDPEGRSGLGHLLEHLYVTAAAGPTPSRTADEWMARGGGNAQTGETYTLVAEMVGVGGLKDALADAAARMGDLRVTEADLRRERPRLRAEVENMFGGIPPLAAFNLARERVRPSPGGGRRGGLPAHVDRISVSEVAGRARRYYRPANGLLVVAGDLDPAETRATVEAAFGPIPAGERVPAALPPGPPRPGVEIVPVKAVVPSAGAEACLAYAAPDPGSALYAPFLILAARLVHSAGSLGGPTGNRFPPPVYYAVLDAPEVLSVSAPLRPGETPEQAVARLDRFVAETVARASGASDRRQVEAPFGPFLGLTPLPEAVWARNPYGLALSLGRREQLGIEPARLRAALEAVTAEQVAECARSVFAPERRAAVVVTVE